MPPDVSVVIPIYNAENIIENCVDRLIKVINSLGINYEILLKSDGSFDRSNQILEEIGREQKHVKCFLASTNEGLGATLRSLFDQANGNTVIYCDCDLPFGEQVISLLLKEIEYNDCIIASRYRGTRNDVFLSRKISSRLYFLLCKLLFNIPVYDIGSGSVAIRREVLDKLDLKAKGFGIHAELFIEVAQKNFSIKEIPAESIQTKRSSFQIWKHGLPTLRETMALWLRQLSTH